MQKEKVRVFALARELNMESRDLIALCRAQGIDLKNQLSTVEPDVREQIEQIVRRGAASTAAPKTAAPVLPPKSREVRVLDSRVRPQAAPPSPAAPTAAPKPPAPSAAPPAAEVAPPVPPAPVPAPVAGAPVAAPAPPATPKVAPTAAPPPAPAATPAAAVPPAPVTPSAAPVAPPAVSPTPAGPSAPPAIAPAAKAPAPPAPMAPETAPAAAAASLPPTPPAPSSREVPPPAPTPPTAPAKVPAAATAGRDMRNLDSPGRGEGPTRTPRTPRPSGPRVVSRTGTPPSLKPKPGPGKDAKKPGEPATHKPLITFNEETRKKALTGPMSINELLKPTTPTEPAVGGDEVDDDDSKKGNKKGVKPKPGEKPVAVPGRDSRQQERHKRAEDRKKRAGTVVKVVSGGQVEVIDEPTRHRGKFRPKVKKPGTIAPKGKIVLQTPITVRSLSEAIGVKAPELLFKLMGQGISPTPHINSTLDTQVAELMALEYGREVEIKRQADAESEMEVERDKPDLPESLVPRAPVVTIMGHVDHGKTSLLDRIRKSNVVDTEAGGITQVIRAWRVDHGGRPITFLDTPGHEAFTKMRARGAQVTDIAVIVVAAEDGVMPQTEEAISHAKAAGVSLVVAINKVDLPNANVPRTRQQLYGLNVLPDNMGGDTPFVETSAATGKGIDELLDQISIVAELKELKANPNKPARGTCLEAMLSEGEGVRATLLVQQGTLHRGDVILCGSCFGRVRQMYDDQGRPLEEAGPSVPVRITGLDEVPDADDPFQVVPDLHTARTIAIKRKAKKLEASQSKRTPLTLDQLTEVKIAELKVILKADFRGSIEAIRKELEKLQHEEVRVRILEAATGGITENDVWLALTSPQDTLIVGFNVVPDDRAKSLADEKGVKILQYDIIYNLTKDIRAALEGKLKPREEVVHLGRALVRETFKISRVGTIAGCSVTQGTIKRSAKIRLIRAGVVIYPPPDRTAGLESLKRFKEDVGEVREGFECGIKIAGYDDVKVGDVIEAYRVEEVKRTL